jgi:sortase A
MALYQYVKAPPSVYRIPRKTIPFFSYVLMGLGGGILLWVMWPIVSFAATSDGLFSKIVTPISDAQKTMATPLSSVAYATSGVDSLVSSDSVDYANANMWYPSVPQKHAAPQVNTYSLSIPKLKIQKALVTIAGDDLGASLVHYGGTGLPGQYGNAVVFGHSTLPQFYSPTNYKAIFSLVPTLKIGDEIMITYDGVDYRYVVYEMVVLEPNDLSALEQHFDDSYLTLVTCVPPGTYWKRLNVRAKLSTI